MSPTKTYEHLFFDLDHTLWDFETNSHETLRKCINCPGYLKDIDCYLFKLPMETKDLFMYLKYI
jgi:FMN phosphatase YigB (HAD superfamily)